jgi:hypothetical protein
MWNRYPIVALLQILIFLWGFWLVLPLETFSTTAAYGLMQQMASETVWGGSAIALSAMSATALLIEEKTILRVALLAGSAFWIIVGVTTGATLVASVNVPIAIFLGILWAFMSFYVT